MNENRDSFDHRFGDDLFELIVSYLPIEYKIKYESVSKRFQRYLFRKQRVLIIGLICNHSVDTLQLQRLTTNFYVNVSHLRSVLKKFPNIVSIDISIKCIWNLTDVVNTIANNCHHLNAIRLDFNEIKPNILKKFYEKFGQQLRHIAFEFNHFRQSEELIKDWLQLSPNLTSISNFEINFIDNQILSKRLVKIKDMIVFNTDQNKIRLLSNNTFLNLNYLEICLDFESKPNFDSIEEFSELKKLKVLKIFAKQYYDGSDFWSKTIESIANNCLLLEYFTFESFDTKNKFNTKNCFKSLSHFSNLKKLSFISKTSRKEKEIPLNCLKNCKNLVSLDIRFNAINDYTFEEIHLIVPQLKQLLFESRNTISDRALELISNLKNLTHIEITGKTTVAITRKGVKSLINRCKRFKSLHTCSSVRFSVLREAIDIRNMSEDNKDIEFDVMFDN